MKISRRFISFTLLIIFHFLSLFSFAANPISKFQEELAGGIISFGEGVTQNSSGSHQYFLGNKGGLLQMQYNMSLFGNSLTMTIELNGQVLFMKAMQDGQTESETYSTNIEANESGNILTISINSSVNPDQGEISLWSYSGTFFPSDGEQQEADGLGGLSQYLTDDPSLRPDSLHADPIDTATGAHVIYHNNLLTVWGAQPLSFNIDYHSLIPFPGSLGRGWSHNYEARLVPLEDGRIRIQWNQKRQNHFALGMGKKKRKRKQASEGYQAEEPSGRYYQLEQNVDNTYRVTDLRNKTQWQFNATGQLTAIQNAVGQKIQLTYNGAQLTSVQETISGRQLDFIYDPNNPNKISQVTDPGTGRSITFTYDTTDNLIGIQQANGNQITYTYNPLGQILSGADSQGQIFLNTYDAVGRVIAQDDGRPETALTRFLYLKKKPKRKKLKALLSANGIQKEIKTFHEEKNTEDLTRGKKKKKKNKKTRKRASTTLVIDRNNQIHLYHHDKKLQLRRRTDPEGRRTHYRYDKAGNRRSVKYPGHRSIRTRYDHNNQMSEMQPGGFAALKMQHDENHNLISAAIDKKNLHHFDYDNANRLTRYTDPLGNTYQLTYTAEGLLQQLTKPSGGTTTYTYQQGKPSQIKDSAGNLWNLTYDPAGRLSTITSHLLQVTSYKYHQHDRITSITDPLGNKTFYQYDLRGNLIQITDAENANTTFTYTPHNKLASVTDAQNQTTTFTYDNEDRLLTITDALGNMTQYEYDNAGRKIATIDPLGNRYTHIYDKTGNLTETVDPLDNSQYRLKYNRQNRISQIKTDLGQKQNNHYDKLGNLTRQKQSKGRTTKHDYDALNRLTQTQTSAKQLTQQSFDSDGNLQNFTDPNENTTTLEHDLADRLTALKTPNGQTTTYTYNTRNLIETITSPTGQKTTLTYDPVGRLETLTELDGDTTYTYDNVGRPLTVTKDGKTITRQYDSLGRLTQFTDSEGNTLGYIYDAIGRLTELTYPDGKKVTYNYDANNRLTTVTDWAGRTTQYNYDAAGRLIETQRPNGTQQSLVYGKDKKKDKKPGLLTQLTDVAGNKTLIDYQYNYNHSGQLSRQKGEPELDAPEIPKPVEMSYDADNRLIKYNGSDLDYDANGNLLTLVTSHQSLVTKYDSRNRLLSATSATSAVNYQYDAENRRIAIETPEGTTQLIHNPNAFLSQLLIRKTPDGKTTYYVYGLGLLYQETDNQAKYYHYDQQGNTLFLTDQTGQVTDQFSYSPYGELISRNGITDTPFQYNGRYGVMTDDNGLLQMRARYYSPQLKRFLNQDILLGNIAEPLTLNRFAYANGDPINNIDPFGLAALDSTGDWFQGFMNLYNNFAIYVVPGQAAWNNAMDSLYQGYYLNAGIYTLQSFGEVGVWAATLGYGSAATPWTSQGAKTGAQLEFGFANNLDNPNFVLYKTSEFNPSMLKPGEYTLNLPNLGSTQLNWLQNQQALQKAMKIGNPIREANPLATGGFLQKEREFLSSQGWQRIQLGDDFFWVKPSGQ